MKFDEGERNDEAIFSGDCFGYRLAMTALQGLLLHPLLSLRGMKFDEGIE
jgi:hypothetical protein